MKINSFGQNLWNRAVRVIPGGNGLLSKDLIDTYLQFGLLIFLHVKV